MRFKVWNPGDLREGTLSRWVRYQTVLNGSLDDIVVFGAVFVCVCDFTKNLLQPLDKLGSFSFFNVSNFTFLNAVT